MTDFLLELLSEEIPARMQDKACADLERLFAAEIARAGLQAEAIETYATPRRLALIARGLPAETAAVSEETKGPKASAPPQALEGFLRKTGLTREQLTERDGVLFAVIEKPGGATAAVLAEAVPAIVRAFPWPKAMRWGAASASTASLRWVRPLQGIVALFGEDVVDLEIDGLKSKAATRGHRFHHPGIITIGSAEDYIPKLRACHVILSAEERKAIIRDGAAARAAARGLRVIPDEGLVAENAGLTEWPVPLIGDFDPAFLDVPREVIQLTMRTNQKYFACTDGDGRLAPAFICTANIEAPDGGAGIVAGNRKVLAARLSDAKFFWEQDLKVPLEEQAKKLSQIVFHEKLGTVADKVERVAKLARWLVEEGIVRPSPLPRAGGAGGGPVDSGPPLGETPPTPDPSRTREGDDAASLADMAEQAARLCKADLVTGMVGEFPELQGVMGGYYARAEGLRPEVADAIRDHYKPVGQGDDVPTAPVTVAVSLADKLDTLVGFFGAGMPPSGSKDPFALRRAALGVLQLLIVNALRFSIRPFYALALQDHVSRHVFVEMRRIADSDAVSLVRSGTSPYLVTSPEYQKQFLARPEIKAFVDGFAKAGGALLDFFADRLKVQQREAGVRHDLIDAVFALGGEDDLVRLLARVKALQGFVASADGVNLLAGYKRAANILKKEGYDGASEPGRHPGPVPGSTVPQVGERADGWAPEQVRGDGSGYQPKPAEADLIAALDVAERLAGAAVADERFEDAMAALATLRAPIDAFFEGVTVNDADPDKRAARLALLARIRAAVHRVADFSKIEG